TARLGASAASIRQELFGFCAGSLEPLRRRLERAKAEGDLPPDSDPGALARYISAVAQGISVQAVSGVSRKELRNVVKMALRAWPAPHPKSKPKRKQTTRRPR
ncbi:MAG: hypothetical protein ACRD7E_15130, partial [Bryobacteraceae bacterium]